MKVKTKQERKIVPKHKSPPPHLKHTLSSM